MYLQPIILHARASISFPIIPVQPLSHVWANGNAAACILLTLLAWILLSLKCYTRNRYTKMCADDYWFIVAVIFYTIFCSGVAAIDLQVVGKSVMSSDMLSRFMNILLMCEIFYVWTMIVFKISLSLYYLRFLLDESWQRGTTLAVAGICVMFSFSYFWFLLFQCGLPGSDFWFKLVFQECVGDSTITGFGYAHAAIQAVTDLALASLLIPVLKKAKLSHREKILAVGIMVFGLGAIIAAFVRIAYTTALINRDTNFWKTNQPYALTSTLEPGFAIIALGMASLRPLIRKPKDHSKSSRSSTRDRSRKYTTSSRSHINPTPWESQSTQLPASSRFRVSNYISSAISQLHRPNQPQKGDIEKGSSFLHDQSKQDSLPNPNGPRKKYKPIVIQNPQTSQTDTYKPSSTHKTSYSPIKEEYEDPNENLGTWWLIPPQQTHSASGRSNRPTQKSELNRVADWSRHVRQPSISPMDFSSSNTTKFTNLAQGSDGRPLEKPSAPSKPVRAREDLSASRKKKDWAAVSASEAFRERDYDPWAERYEPAPRIHVARIPRR